MPEFAKREYFGNIRFYTPTGTGYIVVRDVPIKTQDLDEIDRYGRLVPLYDDMTTGAYQEKNSRGQIPTGTYIVLNGDDTNSASVSGIIFTTAKRDGRGANAIYYNEGSTSIVNKYGSGYTLYKADIFAAYHPPALPIFVKDKRIGGLWVKQGQQLVKPSGVYVRRNGTVKKL